MKDLLFFVFFILIFLCAFSITSWLLITSASKIQWAYSDDGQIRNATVTLVGNHSWTWQLLRDITHYSVWKVFGQVDRIGRCYFLYQFAIFSYICVVEGTDSYSNIAFILTIIFVAIANTLLLNVLIALFK